MIHVFHLYSSLVNRDYNDRHLTELETNACPIPFFINLLDLRLSCGIVSRGSWYPNLFRSQFDLVECDLRKANTNKLGWVFPINDI